MKKRTNKTKERIGALLSIGHGAHTTETFISKLRQHHVDLVVDVRTFPRSFRHPHFSKMPLQATLEASNIKYLWYGNRLGGRGNNRDYEGAIEELSKMTRDGKRICVLCSESRPEECHRHLLLEPSFTERDITMQHILYEPDEK